MKARRRVRARVDEIEHRRGREDSQKERRRNVPADRARVEQVETAERDEVRYPFPAAAAEIAEQRAAANLGKGPIRSEALLDEIERSRACHGVDIEARRQAPGEHVADMLAH